MSSREKSNQNYIYILTNEDWDYGDKYKFGYIFGEDINIINRLRDSTEQHSELSFYTRIYKIQKTNTYKLNYIEIDKIFSIFSNKKEYIKKYEEIYNISLPNLKKLHCFLIKSKTKIINEFIKKGGLKIIDLIIKEEFPLLGLKLIKEYTMEEVNIINNTRIKNQRKQHNKLLELIDFKLTNVNKTYLPTLKKNLIIYIHPLEYQNEAIIKAIKYYKTNTIGKILWACGLGKTYLSLFIWYNLKYKNLLICVSSIYLLGQFKDSIIEIFKNQVQIFKIGDNINELNEYIKCKNKYKILISTYHSCYRIAKTSNLYFDMKIGDECHHLTGSKKEDLSKDFNKYHQIKSKNTLLLTATSKEIENSLGLYTMSNIEQFGEIIDEKSIKWAIENKKITDYEIICIENDIIEISDIINGNEIEIFGKCDNKKELLLSAYCALKSISDGICSHLLIYTNKCESADIVQKLITIILHKKIFDNLDINDFYNKRLDSKIIQKDKLDLKKEVSEFKKAKFGIISCVYIFGEGTNILELNGVVIAEKMTADIRIIQSLLRANRLDSNQINKIAKYIIPYNINSIEEEKIQVVIEEMGKCDDCIEQKVKFMETKKKSTKKKDFKDKNVKLNENKDKLIQLRLKYFTRNEFSFNKQAKIYKLHKEYYKGKFSSVDDYEKSNNRVDTISKPDKYFTVEVWNGWYDYLSIDISLFPKNTNEWKKKCNMLNINSVEHYDELCSINNLPKEPNYVYFREEFSSIYNELELNDDDYLFY